ncbi:MULTISPECIES: glycosyltransferase family 4 protein [Cellulophaga]|uniref:Glycosyltransferase involved in cell wall bisynthesis n=1 Tax=Cellulophaga baltica TaxID=76594 RepID=A0A1G7K2C7_9FLAO|nr:MULTISPECIES: glycosyltransferase family 4 protein [Cellulophaga]QXP52438.1 glycosyltransferase family 4 protein [Cellulophaga sp. HaHa_2_1]SDF31295.1 Glycosyltransferase involved in cell wall bisynthesis [Cellulophaga baltica]
MKKKIIRITTVPQSLGGLLTGQLSFMSDYYDVIGISSNEQVLKNVGIKEGINVIPLEMTRSITPFKDLKAIIDLYKILKKEKPFIVHSHTPKAGMVAMIASRFARVPNRLHTIAGLPLLEATGLKRVILNFVEKLTYGCATKIYPNSYGLKKIILEEKFTIDKKLKVIGNGSSNGIDTSIFDPKIYTEKQKKELKKSLHINDNDVIYTFVGRLVKDKGINELVAAFTQLEKEKDNVKLLLVGTYESELDPLSTDTLHFIENNKNIINVGWQNDVRPYFSISNFLTFPSYREGFPNVVLQASAMKLYSIVTDINGCNEIVIEGLNGTIIPTKNTEQLYTKMLNLHDKNISGLDLEKCRSLIIEKYERTFVWKKLLEEYQSLENEIY